MSPIEIDDIKLKLNLSVGISLFPQHGQTAEQLVNAANIALVNVQAVSDKQIQIFNLNQNGVNP